MANTAQQITDRTVARQKERVSFGETDQRRLTSLFASYPELDGAIAVEFADRLRESLGDDQLPFAPEELEATVEEFLDDLQADAYDTGAYERRVAFGRRCAERGLSLSAVQAAFQSYTTVAERRLDGGGEATAQAEEPSDTSLRWYRGIERAQTLDTRGVLDGYERTREEQMVPREDLTAAIEEIEQRHFGPIEASGTVIDRGSEEVCDLVGDQTTETQQMSEEIGTLSATVEEVAASANQVDQVATDAEQTAADGKAAAEDAIAVMEAIEQDSRTVADDIERLTEKVGEIDEITAVISEIADQTNMLALNASIEAARAGEAGEGFAVVAEEVKSLAEESQQQATEVGETVEAVQEVTTRTVENLQQTNARIDEGLAEVEDAMEKLEDIALAVTEASEGTTEIAQATSDQAEMAESVARGIEEVADRADEVQVEIDRIAAANREQSDKIEDMTSAVADLASLDTAGE